MQSIFLPNDVAGSPRSIRPNCGSDCGFESCAEHDAQVKLKKSIAKIEYILL
jgi:hypothetical protein